ncbi:MAG: hypothetical protein EBT94_04470 [Alphaproteobacteria bacterium]|nr:hypothetical protein [Alphaproteobacteria bacterium]
MTRPRSDTLIGLNVLAIATMIAFVWVPFDSETGLIEHVRRRYVIGDALAPTIAALIMGLAALGLIFRAGRDDKKIDRDYALSLLVLVAVCGASLALMRYAGPVVVGFADMLTAQEWTYRSLRATVPFRYIGFLTGGTALIAGLSWFMDGRISRRVLIRSFLIALGVGCCFDLPFEDIILPPNGDV